MSKRVSTSRTLFVLVIMTALVFLVNVLFFSSINIIFKIYSALVAICFFARLVMAQIYNHRNQQTNRISARDYHPTITFGVPTYNEEKHIAATLKAIANLNYPKSKFNIIAINDGSTDRSLDRMQKTKRGLSAKGVRLKIIDFKENRGKRAGMAEIIRQAKGEILIFIDSDTIVAQNTARELIKFFSDKKTAAVAGHAYAANKDVNFLTRMQNIRYYGAFAIYKSSEALFGNVVCCSGCCAAYRTKYLKKFVNSWEKHRVMGIDCECGDDRSLTNLLLRNGYSIYYARDAVTYTFVPETVRGFLRQQLRWGKSWLLENIHASTFMLKRWPFGSILFYPEFLVALLAPFMIILAAAYMIILQQELFYWALWFFGLMLAPFIQGLYYNIHTGDKKWFKACVTDMLCSIILNMQLVLAAVTLRNTKWGTREEKNGQKAG